jgi:hypothetical protein
LLRDRAVDGVDALQGAAVNLGRGNLQGVHQVRP